MWTLLIKLLCSLALSALLFNDTNAAPVVKLSEDNFDAIVDGKTNVLVEFFAPWLVTL